MKTIWKTSALVSTIVLLAGCAKVPHEAIESASVMIEDAQVQEADVYATDQFAAAQDSFAAAQTEIELQNGKFALVRNYDHAEHLLTTAAALAREAGEAGVASKQEMQTETENLLVQGKEAAMQASALLKKAPTGKEGRAALAAIATDINALDASFAETDSLLAEGQVKSAHDRAQASLDRARGLAVELQTAIDKTK